jgi:threonylcarbamoyladenosine tRNA methylthiotransferase MtaB
MLSKIGLAEVKANQVADICVINTCAVTEHSEKKCRQLIRKIAKENGNTIIALTGCYVALSPNKLKEMKEVAVVAQQGDLINDLLSFLKITNPYKEGEDPNFFEAYSSGGRTRSFLKVQDGCDYKCSYCTIPLARGNSRNKPIENVIKQAKEIALLGVKEVVITGVNTGDFGKSTNESFYSLMQELEDIDGIERYRISSIEPNLLTDEIIELVAKSRKFLPHFHIPLQAGNNRILGLMRRRYKREVFADRIYQIKDKMPHAFIGVDVIVGFPTETDDEFIDTYNFLEQLSPSFLHVFPYSVRPNTVAAEMPQVQSKAITERAKKLGELSSILHNKFYNQNIGRASKVLFESTLKNGKMFGFTENYIKVQTDYNKALINQIVEVELLSVVVDAMLCKLL